MNTARYLAALEKAVCQFNKSSDATSEQAYEVMSEFFGALRLGKVEAVLRGNDLRGQPGAPETKCFYDSGKASEGFCITESVTAPDETVIVYHIYPIEGEPEWTEDEQHRIHTFIALLSAFNGKARLAGMVQHLSFHENELDMYNYRQFTKCVRILCSSGQIDQFTALRFNLKHFSIVNQNIGRDNGTLVMKMFIGLITDLFDSENEVVCRLGGDNFVALVKTEKLQSVLDILSGTGVVFDEANDERIMISATVGVYVVKDRDIFPPFVMDRTSLAAQLARTSSETDVVYFNEEILAQNKRYNEIAANFPNALKDREFLVYYQPKVAIDGRRIAGAEALCRWMHNGKMISPGEFIPVLEQGRDICKLDFYMLDAVCRDIRRWLDNGMNVVRVSVNFSRRHLSDIDLLERIIETVDRHNVPHEYIEIELTETTTDVEFKDLKKIINGLQRSGFFTSVDDFGIGYSSLNLIKELPWNVLKLDRSLLPDAKDENPVQKGIMFNYIVAMAQEMGLECISEGVETIEQVQLLADNKCRLAQGFYFDRPLSVEEFEKRLDKNFVYDR